MIDFLDADLSFRSLQLARNRIEHNIQPADPEAIPDRSRLKYYLEIRTPDFAGSSTYDTLLTLPGRERPAIMMNGVPSYEGAYFPFHTEIDSILERSKPVFGQKGLFVISSLTTPYILKEYVENDGEEVSTVTNTPEWAIKAGLLEEDFQTWGPRFFSEYQQKYRKFLTWQPDGGMVCGSSENYLYFLMNCSPMPDQVNLRLEVTKLDGQRETRTVDTLVGVQYCQIVGAAVGPAALGVDTADVLSYQVWLSSQNTRRISEVRTFYPEHRYQAQTRCLLFSNSFHVFDTIRLVGKGSEQLSVTRSTASRERPQNAGIDFSEMYVIDRSGDRQLTVSTGYFQGDGAAYLRYLDELLLAEEWYLITEKGHQPLELLTNSIQDIEPSPGLFARTFTFRYAYEQNNFSSLPVAPAAAVRETYWRGVGIQQILGPTGLRTGKVRPIKLEKRYQDDDSLVIPTVVKPNVPGDPDYIAAVEMPGIVPGSSPFPSKAINRTGSYARKNCSVGQVGGPAQIIIPEGTYGGENEGEADALAEAQFKSLDTQATADQLGTCVMGGPQYYMLTVPPPDGFWNLRLVRPKNNDSGIAGGEGLMTGDQSKPSHGNRWYMADWAGKPGNYVYLNSPLDMLFPIGTPYRFDVSGWNMPLTIRVFVNGGANPVFSYSVELLLQLNSSQRRPRRLSRSIHSPALLFLLRPWFISISANVRSSHQWPGN
ncbi:hypothetical protein BWI93_10255 [Siphonobacter sp. BAB-5385]|uniref:DUF5977 domain-containing protein n=1 Tax=Siphonobacter sp. BAB-5385 TaxID=1864822 RepID=UPI000B9E7B4B|nr:hypothetical protein [Siphonobacter sp. BAB-5385]OZI08240.1 hypothetical protein BWI93_10255 [Siphonobacter sp. BAB-5385]